MITGRTRVLGVVGHPVEHTSSPAMHNAAIQALGLDYVYVAFHVRPEGLGQALAGMRGLELHGLNVTVPHKLAVMEWLDEVSEEARTIGAVNTVVRQDGRLSGHNTDAHGALAALRHAGGLDRLPARVALLGAGGAARAILYGMLRQSEVEEVLLLNRTVARAEQLAQDLDPQGAKVRVDRLGPDSGGRVRKAGLLVNATSVGMYPHEDESPLTGPECLHPGMVVLDIVYNPLHTRLLAQAETAGARTVHGLGMLAHQGARSFALWTGIEPPVQVMLEAALERLARG